MEYGLLLPPIYNPAELVKIARCVEEMGFSSFWYPDEKFFRDCYVGLSLVAEHTDQINLGPCVTEPYSRHPIMTAVSIASLSEIAPGRTWLGLGAGGRGFQAMGIQRQRPARAIREAVQIIRDLLAGERVDYQGQVIQINDRPLDFSPPEQIPILIATGFGHKIQTLAGEIADAVMLANYASKEAIAAGISRIRAGAKKANRTLENIRLISRVDVAVNLDGNLAREAVAPKILSAIRASYPSLTYFDDLPDFELSSKFLSVIRQKDYKARTFYADPENSAPLIPPELYHHFSVAGTPDEVARQLEGIRSLGVFDEITLLPVPSSKQTIHDCLLLVQDLVFA